MSASHPISLSIDGTIATLTMDDGRANAVNFVFLEQFDEALRRAEKAHVLVIRGRERVFCGGLDLPALLPLDRTELEAFFEAFDRVHEHLLRYPRPIVTCARSSAIAGGAILFCAGDARLASESGKIGLIESTIGLSFPITALELVRMAIGDRHLTEATIFGTLYEGVERVRLGFVTEVVPEEWLDERAHDVALGLASADPDAVAIIREQIRRPAIDRVQAHAATDRVRFLDRWFAPEGQRRAKEIVVRLTRGR